MEDGSRIIVRGPWVLLPLSGSGDSVLRVAQDLSPNVSQLNLFQDRPGKHIGLDGLMGLLLK